MPKIIGYEKEGATYDIICHDMVLDAAKVYEIMPPDTKFIGLLRDPVYHFKALWDAHRHKVRFKAVIHGGVHHSLWTITYELRHKIYL